MRVFGAKCWAKIPTALGGSKLDPHSVECRLLGYATGHGNYKVQDATSHHVFVSRDVIFEEGQPHRTSASVGENISVFETNTEDNPPTDKEPDLAIIDTHAHHDLVDPVQSDITAHHNPVENAGRNEGKQWANITIDGLVNDHEDVIACLNEQRHHIIFPGLIIMLWLLIQTGG